MVLKTVVAPWREERSVWKPNLDAGPPYWKKMERTLCCPCDGLDPCHWLPCGRWRGECKDLAICRMHIILWASGRDDYPCLSCGEKNANQEAGLITTEEGRCLRGARRARLEDRNGEVWVCLEELPMFSEMKHGHTLWSHSGEFIQEKWVYMSTKD